MATTNSNAFSITIAAAPTTALATLAASMSAGQWAQLTVSGLSTSLFITGANKTSDWMSKGGYDPIRKQIRFFGAGHLEDRRWHQFDENSNTWSNLPDPPWDPTPSSSVYDHGYHGNTVDPATGDWYYNPYNSTTVHRYIQASGTWTTLTRPETGEITVGLEWVPTIGTQGGLICAAGTQVQRWDKATNSWTTTATMSGQSLYNIACYSTVHDVVFVGGGYTSKMWKVAPNGAATAIADCPVSVGSVSSVTACCPVSGELVVIAGNASARKFNAGTGQWSTLTLSGAPSFGTEVVSGSGIIAMPVSTAGVIAYLFATSPAMWLYKNA